MGLSKKKTKGKSTATNAPSAEYRPYINNAAETLQPAYEAATANNATLMPRITGALDSAEGTMRGDYLDGNPHLDGVIEATGRDITTGVDSRFSAGGRYGSGAHQGILARALGDNASRIRYGDYAQERQYQAQAPGQVASIAGVSSALPQAASANYADAVRALLSQYNTQTGTSTSTQSGGLGSQLLAAAAQVGASYAGRSDRRLKRNIEKVGELEDGLGLYVWEYLWGKGQRFLGVMADEVAKLRPWALGPEVGGFQTVAYGRL